VSAAKSVAVLPFANMSADADNEYFADGIAEAGNDSQFTANVGAETR